MLFHGTVKWFNNIRGYGFIESDAHEKDIFVHITEVKNAGAKTLREGQEVSYTLVERNGRMAAGELNLEPQESSSKQPESAQKAA